MGAGRGREEKEVNRLKNCLCFVQQKHLLHGSQEAGRGQSGVSLQEEPRGGKVSAALMRISQLSCAARGGVGPLSSAHLSVL